ncbi:MAG: outer membrane beta-barrel protein, partial [Prolixibacteraceae bacterium]|nr:outer membrane beta-barrel protein [Prolixibacteraceae bacterium]
PQKPENRVEERNEIVISETINNERLIAEASQNENSDILKTENTISIMDEYVITEKTPVRNESHLNLLKRINVFLKSIKPADVPDLVQPQNNYPSFHTYENELIALKSANTVNKIENKWKVGFSISPGYSSQNSSHSEVYSKNMTYSNKEGTSDINGGFSVEYKAAKRLSIESGIYYSQNGQQSGNSPLFFNDQFFASSEKESAVDYFNTPVEISDGKMLMNSTAGIIVFDGTPENAELSANFDRNGGYSNALLTESEFSQVFDFIEIPVLLKYNIIDKKIAVDLIGGLSANWVVGNNAYIGEGSDREYIGKTSDISALNYSGTFGFGVDYALSKKLSVSVEPRFNYFLNSINKSSAVNYKPYRMGIYTGINYNF